MAPNGYAGKMLRVDLSQGGILTQGLSENLIRDFIGGRGIHVKTLYDEVPPNVGPLDPENRMIIGAGPLAGTLAPSAGRCQCTNKSPLTGILGDSNVGGHFGAELKFAGYDHIVISGKSDKPVYLWVNDDEVELRDASHLWGLDTWETTSSIQDELGDRDVQVLTIGQAGENLVKYSALVCNLTRAAGRGMGGAVFGAKGLKAVAVRGTKGIRVADPENFLQTVEQFFKRIHDDPGPQQRSVEGTVSLIEVCNALGWLSHKNMQFSTNDEVARKLCADSFLKYSVKPKGCFNCPVHCSHFYRVKDGPFEGTQAEGLEFVGVIGLGSKTGVDYYPAVLKANELGNRFGFDVGSVGDVIAWSMECFERGILTEKDTDGLSLEFGNYESMLTLIERIAKREGFGNILADGIIEASKKIGKGSIQFANHIKGLPIMVDVRGAYGFALGHAVSNVGAIHLRGAVVAEEGWPARAIPDERAKEMFGTLEAKNPQSPVAKGAVVQWYERITVAADCVGMCKFVLTPYAGQKLITLEDLAILLSQATGLRFAEKDLEVAAERILALERSFNAREGFSREDDTLPPRMWEPVESGPRKGFRFDRESWDKALDDYYKVHGWNKNGIPSKERLETLNLKYAGEELERLGRYDRKK
jgi:aldehyde:ferredoxin oxidoreductase